MNGFRTKALLLGLAALGSALSTPGLSATQKPHVVASIKPVHSLVAQVMGRVAEPRLLVEGSQSPHTYALKPSEAAALENADLVVWIGPSLETFLARPVQTIAKPSASLELMETPKLRIHTTRRQGAWEPHQHDHGSHGASHNDEHDHGHESDEHEMAHQNEHAHDGEQASSRHPDSRDPHIWLDPSNARHLITAIAQRLIEVDPAHQDVYRHNADMARADLEALDRNISGTLAPVREAPYAVFHDAYQYFERHYGLNAVGSITLSPDRQPGARRIMNVRKRITDLKARCVFREPQFASDLVGTVIEGTSAKIGTLDPIGIDIAPGADAYKKMLQQMAGNVTTCLSQ